MQPWKIYLVNRLQVIYSRGCLRALWAFVYVCGCLYFSLFTCFLETLCFHSFSSRQLPIKTVLLSTLIIIQISFFTSTNFYLTSSVIIHFYHTRLDIVLNLLLPCTFSQLFTFTSVYLCNVLLLIVSFYQLVYFKAANIYLFSVIPGLSGFALH